MNILTKIQTRVVPPIQKTDYIVGSDLLSNLHQIPAISEKNYSCFLILTDQTVFKFYGKKVLGSLKKLNRPIVLSQITSGETGKDLEKLKDIIRPFFNHGFDRKACLISLGGGVITDLGGFLAAILLRGISAVHLPTTLVGQVDASLGGKSGVNFWPSKKEMYKNMLGTIVQPQVVVSDVDVLQTLPKKEILNGLGEMVKYWIGWGRPNLEKLVMIKKAIKTPRRWPQDSSEVEELVKTISLCQQIKIDIIQRDPFDTLHIREKLNFGHTIGHAVEGAADGQLSHGQAVAIGLVAAAKLSHLSKLLPKKSLERIIATIQMLNLPTQAQKVNREKVLKTLAMDKKGGTFVLICDIGKLETGVKVEKKLINKVLSEVIA